MLRLLTENTLDREEKIMAEWVERKISDIGTVVGGATPSTKKPENYEGGKIAWITPKDLSTFSGRYIERGERNITEIGLKSCSTQLLPPNTVLFSSRAPIGYVAITANEVCTNQGFKSVIPNENTDPLFLFYLLKYNKDKIEGMGSGTTFKEVSGNTMKNIVVNVPTDKKVQEKIAAILGSIDDKIEENEQINNNLEQQAMALYENTFCTPSNIAMKHISLSDLMDYSGGSQPPASKFIFIKRDGYIRFVQIRDYDTDSHITYIPESAKNKLCEEHDIMIARYGASLGRICFGINGAYNVALAKVFPKKSYFREFLRCYLSSRTFYEGINNKGGRSAQAGFNQSDINSFELDFPIDEAIVQKFENTVVPMFEQRLQLRKENQRLASLRDTLLPKLMSGELDVSDIDL